MTKMLRGLTLAGVIALSLLASTSDAFAKDHGRETSWTNFEPPPAEPQDILEPAGVTWEE